MTATDPPSGVRTAPHLQPSFRYDLRVAVELPTAQSSIDGAVARSIDSKLRSYVRLGVSGVEWQPDVRLIVRSTSSYGVAVRVLYLDVHARLLAEDVATEVQKTGAWIATAERTRLRLALWRASGCPTILVQINNWAMLADGATARIGRAVARGVLRYAAGVAREVSRDWAWEWPEELKP